VDPVEDQIAMPEFLPSFHQIKAEINYRAFEIRGGQQLFKATPGLLARQRVCDEREALPVLTEFGMR